MPGEGRTVLQRAVGKMRLKAVPRIVLPVLLVGMLTLAYNVQQAYAYGTWLYYDDGECDNSGLWHSEPKTPIAAVNFTDVETCYLLRVRCWIEANPSYSFVLHIMNSNWEDIYTGTCTPWQTGWFEVDLRGESIEVSGQFIVGMEFSPTPADGGYNYHPDLGYDSDLPLSWHSWFWPDYPAGGQEPMPIDYMIRAEIGSLEDTVGGVWVPVDKLALLAPYIALASTILVATAATAIYVKRRKKKQ